MEARYWLLLVVTLIVVRQSNGARILGLFPFTARSHLNVMEPIMKELAFRGHEVTVISIFPQKTKLANYTDVTIDDYNFWDDISGDPSAIFDLRSISLAKQLLIVWSMGLATTKSALNSASVQKIINSDDVQFDLIFSEVFYQEAFLMFAHKFKCPVVTISTFGFAQFMSGTMGNMIPLAHVPHEFTKYGHHMDFWERIYNIYATIIDDVGRKLYYLPKQDELAKEYFKNLEGPLPSVKQLERNVSLLLLNSHVSMAPPRPLLPGIVEVGGLHVRPPKPLPEEYKAFLDGADSGVVYFSLGSNIRSSALPKEKVAQLLNVFGKMKQRILWKWEDDNIPNIPPNVKTSKWMPQSDILAHPNIRCFITHGGLLSTQEAIARGVPLLGIPIYGDQKLNMGSAEREGYGIMLLYQDISEETLSHALGELINNPKYMTNAKRLSGIFRDRPLGPLETAIFWIEYIIRHKGAAHLRSAALELPWYSYYFLDVAAFLLAIVVYFVMLVRMFWGRKKNQQLHKKEKKLKNK